MANEVRLIDANAAMINTYHDVYWTESEAAAVRSFLVHQPTIDTESLRPKGRCNWCRPGHEWCGTCIKILDEYGDGGSDRCSSEMNEEKCSAYKPMRYCPNCGADMRGDNE